jgi:POT family proton-dependent oligopeptide transporter
MLSFSLPLIGNEVPAAVFQSINAFFIIVLGTAIGSFWYKWAKKGKESSSLFKMAIGVIIMAFGFFFMSKASTEVVMDGDKIVEKSAMIWLVLAYLFHTIGELCASPVALSFITKLAPLKYDSFMMGAYFAATG